MPKVRRKIAAPSERRVGLPRGSGMKADDVRQDLKERFNYTGEFVELFAGNTGAIIHKWHHYMPLYERYFSRFRNRPLRFLEIGVSRGGSLQMWRKYFGPDAVIFGIDIDRDCAKLNGQAGQVRIGSQDDPEFLKAVVEEMGGVDVVLDDGSHIVKHIKASLKALFPLLAEDGIYMIEDLHTTYLRRFGGVRRVKQLNTHFYASVVSMIHDMHHWYHDIPYLSGGIGQNLAGVSFHDSIVVLEKSPPRAPVHTRVF